jgi:hypothetical protein
VVRRGLAPAAAALWAEMAAALIKHSARFVTSSPAAGAVPVAVTALAEGVIQMMWLARLRLLVAVTAALILATAGVAVQGRQQPAPELAREQARTAAPPAAGAGGAAVPNLAANQAIARKQLALIDEVEGTLRQLARTGRMSVADSSFSLWGPRRLEALRRAGAGKAEIVAAVEKYIAILKEDEAFAESLKQSARGTQLGVYDVQFRRMEAEIWLNDEKAR